MSQHVGALNRKDETSHKNMGLTLWNYKESLASENEIKHVGKFISSNCDGENVFHERFSVARIQNEENEQMKLQFHLKDSYILDGSLNIIIIII